MSEERTGNTMSDERNNNISDESKSQDVSNSKSSPPPSKFKQKLHKLMPCFFKSHAKTPESNLPTKIEPESNKKVSESKKNTDKKSKKGICAAFCGCVEVSLNVTSTILSR